MKAILLKNGQFDINKIFKQLKDTNYYFSMFSRDYEKGFMQPSFELSEKLGFKIHEDWNIPNGWPLRDIELFLLTYNDNQLYIKNVYNLFTSLNPQLLEINLRTEHSMRDIVYGAVSKFNYDDIKEFVGGGFGCTKQMDPVYSKKLDRIESKFGHSQFVLSYKTIETVLKHLK